MGQQHNCQPDKLPTSRRCTSKSLYQTFKSVFHARHMAEGAWLYKYRHFPTNCCCYRLTRYWLGASAVPRPHVAYHELATLCMYGCFSAELGRPTRRDTVGTQRAGMHGCRRELSHDCTACSAGATVTTSTCRDEGPMELGMDKCLARASTQGAFGICWLN